MLLSAGYAVAGLGFLAFGRLAERFGDAVGGAYAFGAIGVVAVVASGLMLLLPAAINLRPRLEMDPGVVALLEPKEPAIDFQTAS
jgi:hypothetical protein